MNYLLTSLPEAPTQPCKDRKIHDPHTYAQKDGSAAHCPGVASKAKTAGT